MSKQPCGGANPQAAAAEGWLLRRHEAFQFLVEVLDDDNLRRGTGRVGRGGHQKALAIGGDVVVSEAPYGARHNEGRVEHLFGGPAFHVEPAVTSTRINVPLGVK